VSFPDEPTALALPLDNGRTLRGEDVSTTGWTSYPVPALDGYLVQPRSLALYRAEEMVSLDGAVSLDTEGGARRLVNASGFELRDAVVVDLSGPGERKEVHVGTIAPGATVDVKEAPRESTTEPERVAFRTDRLLRELRSYYEDRPENRGEIRLVAWSPRPQPGEKIEPALDRHRGVTAFVVHLRSGPPPSPDGPLYNALVSSTGAGAPVAVEPEPPGVSAGVAASLPAPTGTMTVRGMMKRPSPGPAPAAPARDGPSGR
jgi:hypothetical protein